MTTTIAKWRRAFTVKLMKLRGRRANADTIEQLLKQAETDQVALFGWNLARWDDPALMARLHGSFTRALGCDGVMQYLAAQLAASRAQRQNAPAPLALQSPPESGLES